MKPGQIRVFDGLRITTEHMNHLQGSFHTSIQDIRGILGTGKVHQGFEVLPEGNAIIVKPGLAFDSQKNRIVLDEPERREVKFGSENDIIYVFIKYKQIEEGQVEGQSTIIWDSCEIVMQSALPDPQKNMIPIAELIRSKGNEGTFEIMSLVSLQSENKNSGGSKLLVSQGVVRMSSETVGNDLNTLVSEVLGKETGSEKDVKKLRITLGEKEVPLNFQLSSLTCQTIISCVFGTVKENNESKANGEMSRFADFGFQAIAHGEVIVVDKEVSQFGVSNIHPYLGSENAATSWITSELTESGIAHLPLSTLLGATNKDFQESLGFLSNMDILVAINGTNTKGFKVICQLLLNGGIDERIISIIETIKSIITWNALISWKALGDMRSEKDIEFFVNK